MQRNDSSVEASDRTVPRFFFHLWQGELLIDPEGVELVDAETAIARAYIYARDIAAADVQSGKLACADYIRIDGPGGEAVGCVAFDEAVRVQPNANIHRDGFGKHGAVQGRE